MPRHSKESENDATAVGQPVAPAAAPPPLEGDFVVAGNEEMPPGSYDSVAQDRADPAYLNAAYPMAEHLDPYTYADRSLFDGLRAGPRQLIADRALRVWTRALRRFARATVWTLPLGAVGVALGAAGGWPTRTAPTSGSPSTWLILTISGLILTVLGVVALASLMAPTDGAPWAAGAVVAIVAGSLLLAPVLGLVALVRPAGPRLADGVAGQLEAQILDATTARWFGVSGLVLIAVAGVILGCGVLATHILNRADGWLLMLTVALAVTSAWSGWQFLLVLAGMAMLAASLGLAWTASRLTPDGVLNQP